MYRLKRPQALLDSIVALQKEKENMGQEYEDLKKMLLKTKEKGKATDWKNKDEIERTEEMSQLEKDEGEGTQSDYEKPDT